MNQIQRRPTANLPLSLQSKAGEALSPDTSKVPTYDEVLSGSSTVINGFEIPQFTIDKAREGDQKAQRYILSEIDSAKMAPVQPPIAFTKITDEGIETNLPDNLSDSQKETVEDYVENRKRLFSFLDPKIKDSRVRDLIIDYYRTGEFFSETAAQLAETPRFMANVPNYLQVLGMHVAPAAFESMSGDVTWEEAWAKRQPLVAEAFAKYRSKLDEFGISATYDDAMNDRFKEKFIEKYGQEVYEDTYNPEIEGMGRLELPMIPPGVGEEMLDFGFGELTTAEQGLAFLALNAPISGAFGLVHLQKGKKQLSAYEAAAKTDRKVALIDPITFTRNKQIQEKTNTFTRSWRKMTAAIGATLNNRGPIGAAQTNQIARKNIKDLDAAIDEKTKLLATKKGNDAIVLRGDIDRLQARRNRLIYNGASNPYMFNLFVDESVIAIGQTAGYNLLPGFLGVEPETGGMLGALGFAFGGRPAINKFVGGPVRLVSKIPLINSISSNVGEFIENISGLPKGLLVNRDVAEMEASLGRRLSRQELGSVKFLDKMMKQLDPQQQEMVYKSIDNYIELKDRILSRFPEGEAREEADRVFQLSFAHISGLAPLQALEFNALKNVKGQELSDAVQFQMQSENALEQASLAINRLQELVKTTGVDPENSKYIAGWVKSFQEAADIERMNIANRKVQYMEALRSYKTNMLSNPNVEIDADIVNRLAEMEIALSPNAAIDIKAKREIILKNAAEVSLALNERAEAIKGLRGTTEHRRQLGILQEDIYDAHMSSIYALARNAYTKADEVIGDRDIDIRSAVNALVQSQDDIDSKSLRGLFSAQAEFLSGRSGRMAFNAFNDMAERSLRKNMELDDEDLSELVEWVTTPRLADGKANPDFLGDQVSFVDMALHFSAKEGSGFAPFVAKPFEVDEVRRHFAKKAASIQDDKMAKPYRDAANLFDDALRADPEVFAEVQLARDTYRDLIFDPVRMSSKGDKIVNARSGPEFVTRTPGGRRSPYKLGSEPETWHKDLAVAIDNAMNDKAFASDKLRNMMDDLVRFWGDRDEAGNIVFDLTTERGRAKFENVQNLIRANLHEYWGAAKEKGLRDAVRSDILNNDLPSGTYNFDAAVNFLDRVNPNIQVMVKEGDGPAVQRPLVDLTQVIAQEQDIVDLMAVSKNLRQQYKEFTDEINGVVGDMGTIAAEAVGLRKRTVQQFEQLSGETDPLRFYEKYVLNNDVSLMQGLKAEFVDTMVSSGMSQADALEEFNTGMRYMLTNGLLARAGKQANDKITFKALDGKKRTVETLTDAASLHADLDNPNVTAILEEFMDEDHISFMQDISEYMMYASGAAATQFAPKGQIRGISPNEVISRAFNIARGMVSPTYVAAEFAVRVMSHNEINALTLAASNKEAAGILRKVLETPGEVTQDDIQRFTVLAKSFLARSIYESGDKAPEFVPQDAILAAQQDVQREQQLQFEVETIARDKLK